MTKREYQMCVEAGCLTLGQKIGFIGRMIHSARYAGSYCRPAAERHATVTRLRRLVRRLNQRRLRGPMADGTGRSK